MADTENNLTVNVTVKKEKEDYDEDSPIVDMEALVKVEMTEDVVANNINSLITNFNQEFGDDLQANEEANISHASNPLALSDFDKTIFPSKEKRLAIIRNKSTVISTGYSTLISKGPVEHDFLRKDREQRKKRKVELERERRRELTELYDELQFQVFECDKMKDESLPR